MRPITNPWLQGAFSVSTAVAAVLGAWALFATGGLILLAVVVGLAVAIVFGPDVATALHDRWVMWRIRRQIEGHR